MVVRSVAGYSPEGFSPCYIIAEAGVNHNGDIGLAKSLIDAAVDAGADAVKFQAFRAEELVSPQAPKACYQLSSTNSSESQLEMLKHLEFTAEDYADLCHYCKTQNIVFLATPFDRSSADMLDGLDMAYFKIASGEITNFPLLRHLAKKGKPLFLSTGMSTLKEVGEALEVIAGAGNPPTTLLHCVTEYPAPVQEVNLKAMITMRESFQVPIGYSDHTLGTEVALAAVVLGAAVIEKHLTLGCEMEGPDHRASLEPAEFKQMVRQIKNVEVAMGDGIKRPAPCEMANRSVARRSLFASVAIPNGAVIGEEMVACKRPGKGISAKFYDEIVGRRVLRNFQSGEMLDWEGIHDS